MDADALERAVFIHRYAAVKQQIVVAGLIHRAFRVNKADMPLQLFAVPEGCPQHLHQFRFAFRERQRCSGVNGWEAFVEEFMQFAVNAYGAIDKIGSAEKIAVGHFPFRMLGNQLTFQFHLNHVDCLMHFGSQLQIHRIIDIIIQRIRHI